MLAADRRLRLGAAYCWVRMRAGDARLGLVLSGQVTEIDRDVSDGLIPVGWVFCQALPDDSLKLSGRVGIDFPYRRNLCVDDLMQRVNYRIASERIGSGG